MLNLLLAVLLLPFEASRLDAPRFADRQRARRELHAWYPLSVPFAARVAGSTSSPEARQTAETILDRWESDPWVWDCRVWLLVTDAEGCTDRVSLPWLSLSKYQYGKHSEQARRAMVRLVGRIRAAGMPVRETVYGTREMAKATAAGVVSVTDVYEYEQDAVFPCEVFDIGRLRSLFSEEGVFAGLNCIRFAVRGLPTVTTAETLKGAEQVRKRHADLFIPPPVADMIWKAPRPRITDARPRPAVIPEA